MGVGKSFVAHALSKRLRKRNVSLDKLQYYYYYKQGYDELEVRDRVKKDGFQGYVDYCKQFHLKFVKEALNDFNDCIIDFGGNHTYFDDLDKDIEFRKIIRKQPLVILLLPTGNMEMNAKILSGRLDSRMEKRQRKSKFKFPELAKQNIKFLKDPLIYEISKYVFFTYGRTMESVVDEIIEECQLENKRQWEAVIEEYIGYAVGNSKDYSVQLLDQKESSIYDHYDTIGDSFINYNMDYESPNTQNEKISSLGNAGVETVGIGLGWGNNTELISDTENSSSLDWINYWDFWGRSKLA